MTYIGIVEMYGCGLRLFILKYLERQINLYGCATRIYRTLHHSNQSHILTPQSHLSRSLRGVELDILSLPRRKGKGNDFGHTYKLYLSAKLEKKAEKTNFL